MINRENHKGCVIGSLVLAGAVGLIAAILLMLMSGMGVVGSVWMGVILAVILAALLLWIFCRDLTVKAEAAGKENSFGDRNAAIAAAGAAAAATATASSVAASKPKDEPAKAAEAPKAEAAKPAAKPKAAAQPKAAKPKTAVKSKPAAKSKSDDRDFDGDGVIEGKNEGTRPEQLKAARGGKADDLKMIKGVGPKMEKLCNKLGFYHFDQIASWKKAEVAWVDANLEGFKGRVSRDEWVKQAKILAKGGTTEFSKKVKKGGVY